MKVFLLVLCLSLQAHAVDLILNIQTPKTPLQVSKYAVYIAQGTNKFTRAFCIATNTTVQAYNTLNSQFRYFVVGETEDGYPTTPTPIHTAWPTRGAVTNHYVAFSSPIVGRELKTEVFFPPPPKKERVAFKIEDLPPVPGAPPMAEIPAPLTLTNK